MNIRPTYCSIILLVTLFALAACSTLAQVSPESSGTSTPKDTGGPNPQNMILTSLTAEDMKALVAGMPPQMRSQLAESDEARKDFAEQMKKVLSLAAEARSSGIADRPETNEELDLMRTMIVAELYEKIQADARGPSPPFADIKEDDVKAFLGEQGQEEQFKHFLLVAKTMELLGDKALAEDELKQLKDEWAKVMITERKAVKAEFDRRRNVQLQVAFQQARFLAQQYAKVELEPQIIATDLEIDAYITTHPELDDKKLRARAEMVLRRARRGESFAALAKKFSNEPGTKDKGGDLGWFGRGVMIEKFEDAAFKLRPGQISNVVQTEFGFHIIKVDKRRRKKNSNGKLELEVRASHILISSWDESDFRVRSPKSGRDKARDAVEKEKRERLLAGITKRHDITVADDFAVEAPAAP